MRLFQLVKISKNIRNLLIGIYILIVLGISATARADVSIYPISGQVPVEQVKNFVGEVAVTLDGEIFLVLNDQEYYQLASTDASDLSEFNGLRVIIQGFKLMHKSGPVITVQSMDPLDGETGEKRGAPVLVVLKISEIAE